MEQNGTLTWWEPKKIHGIHQDVSLSVKRANQSLHRKKVEW